MDNIQEPGKFKLQFIVYKIILRYEQHMSIRKGLRFGDDDNPPPVNPQQYGATGFNADRNRTNFEKDVDNLLFGDVRPPPRRKQGQTKPPEPQKKPAPPAPTEQKKPVQVEQKKPEPVVPVLSLSFQKPVEKPKQPQSKKIDPVPPKKIDNFVQQKQELKERQVIQQQPKNVRPVDSEEIFANLNNLLFFNRPSYIRKLKKVAQEFDFLKENQENHRFIEVLRPSQCIRAMVKKLNYPDFQDFQFPPNWTSIGKDAQHEGFQWKKPQQLFKSPVFGKYIDPNDIQPGLMSSPQFLSTLSCLSQRQQNIKRLIQNQKINQNGFYYVRLNVNGVWRYISVDQYLPQMNGKPVGARSYNDSQSELWVSLVQKAYAKVYHGYNVFKQIVPRQHYLRDLTGAPVRKCQPSQDDFTGIINEALQFGWPVIAVPSQKIIDLGLNPNYSLSVIKASGKGLQLRSSWGTISEKAKINISRQGSFQLSLSQAKQYLSYVIFAQTDSSILSTTIQSKHTQNFYSCYSFKLNNSNPNATLSISQFDRRLFSEKANYKYCPFRLVLQKKNVDDSDNHSNFVNAGFSYKSRNLDLAVNLTPGLYYLYVLGSWTQAFYDYNLTVFANQLVQLTKIYHSNFPNIIAEALTEQCLSKGKRSAKGNVDEYILYHEPSNLVLITALSLVDRAFNHTLNLQQVKPDNLSLINVVKPEDNFAKKLRKDVKDYKDSVFKQKTWDVNLLPHEKYTWVFSSNQDYDPNNFKNWGFK